MKNTRESKYMLVMDNGRWELNNANFMLCHSFIAARHLNLKTNIFPLFFEKMNSFSRI